MKSASIVNVKSKLSQQDQWEILPNQIRQHSSRADVVKGRITLKKTSGVYTLNLMFGRDITEVLEWDHTMRVSPRRNRLNGVLLKFVKIDSPDEGYKLYNNNTSQKTHLQIKMKISWSDRFLIDRTRELEFDISDDGLLIDISELIIK